MRPTMYGRIYAPQSICLLLDLTRKFIYFCCRWRQKQIYSIFRSPSQGTNQHKHLGLVGVVSHLNKSLFKAVFSRLKIFWFNFSVSLLTDVVTNVKCHIMIPYPGHNSKYSSIYRENKKITARTGYFQDCLLVAWLCVVCPIINNILFIKHMFVWPSPT